MVDLSRDKDGHLHARLLDLVPGRSGEAYKTWLHARGDTFRKNVKVATLDPFHGYKNAIDDQLHDAVAVLDAFHIVKLGTAAVRVSRVQPGDVGGGHRGEQLVGSTCGSQCGDLAADGLDFRARANPRILPNACGSILVAPSARPGSIRTRWAGSWDWPGPGSQDHPPQDHHIGYHRSSRRAARRDGRHPRRPVGRD